MIPQIRRVRPDEWREVRSLRLRALREVPTAYGSTLAEEQAFSDAMWRERTLGASSGCERATFIAESEGVWLGCQRRSDFASAGRSDFASRVNA